MDTSRSGIKNWTRKILAQKILIFPYFFTIKNPKFNLIFIFIFTHFQHNFHSYISTFFTIFLTKNSLLIRSQISTLIFIFPTFFITPPTKNNLSHWNSIYLKKTLIWSAKIAKNHLLMLLLKFHRTLFNHISCLKSDTPQKDLLIIHFLI